MKYPYTSGLFHLRMGNQMARGPANWYERVETTSKEYENANYLVKKLFQS